MEIVRSRPNDLDIVILHELLQNKKRRKKYKVPRIETLRNLFNSNEWIGPNQTKHHITTLKNTKIN